MVKQLYYSEIHSKNIEIYLSKLYIGKYSEVNDIISTYKNIAFTSVNSMLNKNSLAVKKCEANQKPQWL